jgi:hypothetical protein
VEEILGLEASSYLDELLSQGLIYPVIGSIGEICGRAAVGLGGPAARRVSIEEREKR